MSNEPLRVVIWWSVHVYMNQKSCMNLKY